MAENIWSNDAAKTLTWTWYTANADGPDHKDGKEAGRTGVLGRSNQPRPPAQHSRGPEPILWHHALGC